MLITRYKSSASSKLKILTVNQKVSHLYGIFYTKLAVHDTPVIYSITFAPVLPGRRLKEDGQENLSSNWYINR